MTLTTSLATPADQGGHAIPPGVAASAVQGTGPLLLALLAVLAAHAGTMAALTRQWWAYLNHGFVLVALVTWLVWRDRRALATLAEPWRPAAFVVAGASLVWFLGSVAGIQLFEQAALLAVLGGWALGVLGLGCRDRLLVLAAYLALALPAWGLLNGPLQLITVAANSVLLPIAGLEAKISGTFIAIPEGTFEVAQGCSGLNYFLSGLTIGVVYQEITPLTARGRWLAVSLVAGLSLLSNWVRVFLLILVGHVTNMQSPLVRDHVWFGWVIFAVMVGLFLWLSRYIEARYLAPRAQASSLEPAPRTPVPAGSPAATRNLWLVTALGLIGPLALTAMQRLPLAPSPAEIAGLSGTDTWQRREVVPRTPLAPGDTMVPVPWAPLFTGADRHVTERWDRAGTTVQVDRLMFTGRDQRHKLIASENVIARDRQLVGDRTMGLSEGTRVRSLRQAVVRVDSTQVRAVLYWYRVGSTSTGVPMVARLLQIPSSLLRRAPSELVAVSAPCVEQCDAAFESLRDFVFGPLPTEANTPGDPQPVTQPPAGTP